jgi:trk system potassium uptake protein TrkH
MGAILRGVGFLLHVPALMALASVPVCLLAREFNGLWGLGATAAFALLLGQILFWGNRRAPQPQRYHAMQIAAVSWVAISVLGALPFLVTAQLHPDPARGALGVLMSPWHAVFESVSGFTSTGLTVLTTPSALPLHLQWWRSLTQWIGGIGVVVLLLTVLPANRGALMLYYSEAREEKILPTVSSTVRWIWLLYLALTVASVLLLMAAGEPFWRALNHGMTAIATGGFSITDDSAAGLSAAVQLALVPIMIAGALSFIVHYRVFRQARLLEALTGSLEIRLFWLLLVAGTAVLALELRVAGSDVVLLPAVFQWVSALTTAGFASVNLADWATTPLLLLLLVAVLIGGMAGSTSGGFKIARLALLLYELRSNLRALRASPHELTRVNYDGHRLGPQAMTTLARSAGLLVGAYLLLWFGGIFALMHLTPGSPELGHVIFDTASALFNSGLSTGVANADLDAPALALLSLLMLIGRLEIFPMLLLMAWLVGRR